MPNHPDLVSGLGQHPVPQVTGMRRLSSCCQLPSPTPQMYKCLVCALCTGIFLMQSPATWTGSWAVSRQGAVSAFLPSQTPLLEP